MDVMATVISWYTEPWFVEFPIMAGLIGMSAFLVYALPWTLLAWVDPEWARPYRIQAKPFEVAEYFWPTLGRIGFNLVMLFLVMVVVWPLLRLAPVHDGPLPEWWLILLQLAFFVVLDDFLYYWMHRWMHRNRWMLRKVHSIHHRLRNPFALAGNYFHWIEFVMTVGLLLVGPVVVGAHIIVVYIWVAFRQLEAADGHTGYDFPWDPMRLVPGYRGALFHDFHHSSYSGNYAGFFPYVDGFYGTYARGYKQHPANQQQTSQAD